MKILFYSFLLITVFSAFSCNEKSQIEKIDNLTILHLRGSDYQKGFAHGQFLKSEINEILERWKIEVEKSYNKDFNQTIDNFFQSVTYVDSIKKYCPELLEEIKGIAEGSGIEYKTILAFQMSEEIDVLSAELSGKHCTSIGIASTDSTPTYLSQNMDPPFFLHGSPVLLHITDTDSKTESYIYTFPGFIGLTGINSNSVAVTCMSMSMLNYSKSGLPVSFIVRCILSQESEEDAFNYIEKVPVSIPQCYIIGGLNNVRCFECSANQKIEFYPFKDKNVCLHSNFSVKNRDFNQNFIKILAQYNKTVDDPYFCPRYFLAYDKIADNNYLLNYQSIKTILSNTESDLEKISNENTYGCLIMKLSKKPILYLAPGRPDETKFYEFHF
jgi:isopenicillin-N N-acyltransferase like protein